jgi:hypothetical protein
MKKPQEKCYCCGIQNALPDFNLYGVPMCPMCHAGMALVSPVFSKPSKEMVDKFRDKMFASVDRIQKASDRMGIPWLDPRKSESTLENQVKAEAKYFGVSCK